MRLLRQPQYHPLCQHEQVILLVAALHHVLQDVPLRQMDQFRKDFLTDMEHMAGSLCRKIDQTGELSDSDMQSIVDLAQVCVRKRLGDAAGAEKE